MARIERQWNTLVEAMASPSFFCTFEWIQTWWEHFGAAHQPFILGAYAGDQLCGLLPLARRSVRFENGWKSGRVLEFCGRGLAPDHLDMVCAPADAAACREAFAYCLQHRYRSWDVLLLSHFSHGAHVRAWFDEDTWGSSHGPSTVTTAPFLNITGTFESYTRQFLKGRGDSIRRKSRRLSEAGFRYGPAIDGDESLGLGTLFSLHEIRAKAKGMRTSFLRDEVGPFHDSLVRKTKEKGWAFLRHIHDGANAIAAFYGFLYGNKLLYYQIGHDPTYDHLSPGSVLMYRVIEEAFARGLLEFDFLRGNEGYKKHWTASSRDLLSGQIYNATPMGVLSRTSFGLRRRLRGTFWRIRGARVLS